MSADSLIDALPDLAVIVRRDGTVLAHGGGAAVRPLAPLSDRSGEKLDAIWPEPVATLLRRCARKAISTRAPVDATFAHGSYQYELHGRPLGPDRAVCVLRTAAAAPAGHSDGGGEDPRPHLDRRGFLKRFRESTSQAALAEKPLAIAIVQLDGIAEISRLIDPAIAAQVMSALILRLPAVPVSGGEGPGWYLGQLGEGLLAVVLESADRAAIEDCLTQLCASAREPVPVGDAEFHLSPYAGVAVLGEDGHVARALVDAAHAAAIEAHHDSSRRVRFFSDGLGLRSLTRLDSARELREAIVNRDIRLHYIGRHDLESGRRVASVGYLRWLHPVRGEVRPAEFLGIAEATGLSVALSRAALRCVADDFAGLAVGPDARVSFGPLRHHVLHADFITDLVEFLASGAVPAERFELRIAERTFVAIDPAMLNPLVERGVQVVVDEVARRFGSFDRLARARIQGLQLDRAWVTALRRDSVALKVCRAGIALASALGLTPIATGVDDAERRDALLALGFRLGSGDVYLDAGASAADGPRALQSS